MNRIIAGGWLLLSLAACRSESDDVNLLKTGTWRAVIEIQGEELPFNLEITRDTQGGYDAYVINADERLLLDEVQVTDDSVLMPLHIFDADIKAAISGDSLHGIFVKNFAKDYVLPFKAAYGQDHRFEPAADAQSGVDFSGKYEMTFSTAKGTRKAIAMLEQTGNVVTGTVLTATGDYRYLAGNATDDGFRLSAFDGDNLYLFLASARGDGSLEGKFFSGKTRMETWVAQKNDHASLPDSESQTWLKEGYDRISFTFPDKDGRMISLDDEKFRNKVVILQILGTWCPNCMDETRFLAPWYDENKDRGVEVIGLAYENKADFDYASKRVKKMIDKMNVHYDIVIAGADDSETRKRSLPMLNDIVAFPTTIFIGKDGKVRKIHTGFNGPGTGEFYDQFRNEFNATVTALVNEDLTAETTLP